MRHAFAAIGIIVGILVGIYSLAWAVSYPFKLGACHYYGYQTDREVKYAGFVGCLVKMPSGWTPRSEIRTEQ